MQTEFHLSALMSANKEECCDKCQLMTLTLLKSALAARTEGWGRGVPYREEAGKVVPGFLITHIEGGPETKPGCQPGW